MQNSWLTHEETFVKMQYNKVSIETIARALGKDVDDIRSKAIDFGLEKNRNLVPEQLSIDLSNVPQKLPTRIYNRKGMLKTKDGLLIYKPDHPYCNHKGYVYEHRLVMEEHLGRYLKESEFIYRKNKDRYDNSLDNLYIKEHIKAIDVCDEILKMKNEPIKTIRAKTGVSMSTIYTILKDDGYVVNEKLYPNKNYFNHKAYVYFKNKGYSSDFICKVLKINKNQYHNLRKVNKDAITYVREGKFNNITTFTFKRMMRKHGVTMRTIAKYYKLHGDARQQIIENTKRNYLSNEK